MAHRSFGYYPLDDQRSIGPSGYSASPAETFRNSRIYLVISLALVVFMVVVYTILFGFFPDLVYQNPSLPAGASQPTTAVTPVPTTLPANLMLQDPRYWSTVNVVYHPQKAVVSKQ